jgi:hypothetical protein
MSNSSENVSIIQMGKRFDIRQGKAWYFKQKVSKSMKSSQRYPLTQLIHVDEFTVGGNREGKQRRSYDSKNKKALIAVELSEGHKVKRV